MGPRWPNIGPSWANMGPRWANIGPRWANIGPRSANIGPRWPNIAPKWAQDRPKTAPHSPKMGSSGPQDNNHNHKQRESCEPTGVRLAPKGPYRRVNTASMAQWRMPKATNMQQSVNIAISSTTCLFKSPSLAASDASIDF